MVIFHQADSYLTEKRFVHEQERTLQLDSMLHAGIHELKGLFGAETSKQSYLFSYPAGTVTITVSDLEEGISDILIQATLKTGHERKAGFIYHWESETAWDYWEVSRHETASLHHWFYGIG